MTISPDTFAHINSFVDIELATKITDIVNAHCENKPAGIATGTLALLVATHIFYNASSESEACQVGQDYGSFVHLAVHALFEQQPHLHPAAGSVN